MTKSFVKVLMTSAVLAVGVPGISSAAECIAPANPGGGWDFTCRQIGKILFDIGAVDKPVQVTNMPGAGGGLAYNTVVSERGADEDLIVAASSATTTRLAQNAYAGMAADQVRFVGAIGADPGVIVVAADSPYQSLGDLVEAIKADPGSVAFAGGSAVGGFDHLKPLMILKEGGFTDITKVKYIGVDGGADAITQTVGGFTQAMTGDMSEIVGFLKSGDVRALAVLTAHPELRGAFVFSHASAESGHAAILDHLAVEPLLDLGLRLGEGTGALLAWPLIKSAAAMLREMASFESAAVSGQL